MCQRVEKNQPIDAGQVENIVKTAINCTDEKPIRAYQVKSNWGIIYVISLIIGIVGSVWNNSIANLQLTFNMVVVGGVMGAYFCFFARMQLPKYYDENKVHVVSDGMFCMNLVGISFNNKNWKPIVMVGRVWSCLMMVFLPILNFLMNSLASDFYHKYQLFIELFIVLGGLFIPMVYVGKKYE